MDANLVAMEVKPIGAGRADIEKDRRNLEYYVTNEVGYQCGVQLVYGDDGRQLERFTTLYREASERVHLFWHPKPGTAAFEVVARV